VGVDVVDVCAGVSEFVRVRVCAQKCVCLCVCVSDVCGAREQHNLYFSYLVTHPHVHSQGGFLEGAEDE